VTKNAASRPPLPDDEARARIKSDLGTNLFVEAGAGSGKTTALVDRLVALISTGTAKVDEIAAVTFTRKAAAELRERFQTQVERTLNEQREVEVQDDLIVGRLVNALDDIDRAFIGTIHSFCARLLRERPIDIGLDPGFEELRVEEREELCRRFWDSYLERLTRDCDPRLEKLSEAKVSPVSLYGMFKVLVDNDDVVFPTATSGLPTASELATVRKELESIVSTGWELMDERPHEDGWDDLQKIIRQLHFEREVTGWKETTDVISAVSLLCKKGPRGHKVVQKRWRDKALAKALCERVDKFGVGDTPAHSLVSRWLGYRYALAIDLGRAAVTEFAAHRMRIGKLDFQDLLELTGRLLRENPQVRRYLGDRYRCIFVDEFQDTDPLQAEIVFLLASDPPEDSSKDTGVDWWFANPRPGSLFVVGDPKQSIYRFRRADIQFYRLVKERFGEFGEVLRLSTNFRSRPAIGELVNQVFSDPDFFPAEATDSQAAFERLDTIPPKGDVPCEGVFVYDVDPERTRLEDVAVDDGLRIASWIRERVDAGQRNPGDFLILTRLPDQLIEYTQVLESHGLPVSVTGSRVGVGGEIEELKELIQCMIDPTNPVRVVAVLTGLFFGLDYEKFTQHSLGGGTFDVMRPGSEGNEDVLSALRRLHGWWRRSVSEPADIFLGSVTSELGLLPYAAAEELGTLRAGALLYVLDSVRAAALAGDASLPGALAAVQAALDQQRAEAPLEPGRPDAVRLMNLHQAKGLEGKVVVLAQPTSSPNPRRPKIHTTRSRYDGAKGYMRVTDDRTSRDLARPENWFEYEALEKDFSRDEYVRLLYVAVTRAEEELVISRWPRKNRSRSPWAPLETWLENNAVALSLEPRSPSERDTLSFSTEEAGSEVKRAFADLSRRAVPTFLHQTVTSLTKEELSRSGSPTDSDLRDASRSLTKSMKQPTTSSSEFRGYSWGSAVHAALAYAAESDSDKNPQGIFRNLLVEHGRPLDEHGEPTELRELIGLVKAVQSSSLWSRAKTAKRMLTEISFALPGLSDGGPDPEHDSESESGPGRARRQLDLFGQELSRDEVRVRKGQGDSAGDVAEEENTPVSVLEGVIDLAFRERGGWVVADYKTDVGTDPDFKAREAAYRRQVDLYANAWAQLTGEPVKERVLFFTAQDRIEQW
jgi:ATP-dependent helicase/nuclease subunit A